MSGSAFDIFLSKESENPSGDSMALDNEDEVEYSTAESPDEWKYEFLSKAEFDELSNSPLNLLEALEKKFKAKIIHVINTGFTILLKI